MRRTNFIWGIVLCGLLAARVSAEGPACDCAPGITAPISSPDFDMADWARTIDACRDMRTYESYRQVWYAEVGAIALNRDVNGVRNFATLDTPTNVVLDSDPAGYDFQGGLRGVAGVELSDWWAVEGSYMGLFNWDDFQAVRDTTINGQGTAGNLFSPFSNFGDPAGVVGQDFNTLASVRTLSRLDALEFNARQYLDTPPSIMRASILYGFRYMRIRERLEYRTESLSPAPNGTANAVDVAARNELFGFQLGGKVEVNFRPRCWIDFEGKAAICHNDADQNTDFTTGTLAGPGTLTSGGRSHGRTAFVGDLSLSLVYQFRDSIAGRVGYQGVFIDGLALAQENFESNLAVLTSGPAMLDDNGRVIYHGPFIGLIFTR